MTQGLRRYYGSNDLHFITCSCYQRQPVLGSAQRRDLLLDTLEETRRRHRFVLVGFVVMPEHLHLLLTEPETGDPSVVMKVLKERFTRKLRAASAPLITSGAPPIASFAMSGIPRPEPAAVWQKRFYDFNVFTEKKRVEKLRYIHRNPVERGLVARAQDWEWSSFRAYAYGEQGRARVNVQEWPLEVARLPVCRFG